MGIFKKKMTGYTESTMKNRQTGAGAYFKNYDVKTDTFSSAVTAGKLLGATQGGGEFNAVPTITQVEVDGVPSTAKGMEEVEGWEVTLKANILEVTPENIKDALGAAKIEDIELGAEKVKYKKITGKMYIEDKDYQDNVTFLGDMSGYDYPIILQVFNALATDGVKINPQDKKTSLLATTFKGHVDPENYEEPPFAIYVPVTQESEVTK